MSEAFNAAYYDRWFGNVRREFCPLLKEFAGQPITYVEIGCWAGASAYWVAKNVLTHPESRGIGIDPYPIPRRRHSAEEIQKVKQWAAERVHGAIGSRWSWIYEPSAEGLKKLTAPIDALYIDGAHDACSVVSDFALAWPLMKVGGIVIFDDYLPRKELPVEKRAMSIGHPHVVTGFAAIKMAWGNMIDQITQESPRWLQRAVRVKSKDYIATP